MSDRGWLRQVLNEAKADVSAWPDWMQHSSWEREPARSQDSRSSATDKMSATEDRRDAKEQIIGDK
jgi:hypothetical protein